MLIENKRKEFHGWQLKLIDEAMKQDDLPKLKALLKDMPDHADCAETAREHVTKMDTALNEILSLFSGDDLRVADAIGRLGELLHSGSGSKKLCSLDDRFLSDFEETLTKWQAYDRDVENAIPDMDLEALEELRKKAPSNKLKEKTDDAINRLQKVEKALAACVAQRRASELEKELTSFWTSAKAKQRKDVKEAQLLLDFLNKELELGHDLYLRNEHGHSMNVEGSHLWKLVHPRGHVENYHPKIAELSTGQAWANVATAGLGCAFNHRHYTCCDTAEGSEGCTKKCRKCQQTLASTGCVQECAQCGAEEGKAPSTCRSNVTYVCEDCKKSTLALQCGVQRCKVKLCGNTGAVCRRVKGKDLKKDEHSLLLDPLPLDLVQLLR